MDIISPSNEAKNLGVLFDSDLSMNSYITSICEAANFQLYRISRIKKYLTPEALKTVVHLLMSSEIGYCNVLLAGLPGRLQHVMNCAARIITKINKF